MNPLGRWVTGAMLIGTVSSAITATVLSIGAYGWHFWNLDTRVTIIGIVIVGAIMASSLRSKIRSARRRGGGDSK
jgi:hypothetical protein